MQEMPISLKSPAFSLEYFPSFVADLGGPQTFPRPPSVLSGMSTPMYTNPGSHNSSIGVIGTGLWPQSNSDPVTFSVGGTPPLPSHMRTQVSDLGPHSLSSSPEQVHHSSIIKRTTGLSNFTGGLARAFNTAQGGFGAVMNSGLGTGNPSP